MALPGMALLAALPLVALARTSPSSLVRVLTLALPIIVICLVNVKWFFIDYPSEGMGGYETAAVGLLSSANVPVFVTNKDFPVGHVTVRYFDRSGLIKPASDAPAQDYGIWATLGPGAHPELESVHAEHPDWRIVTLRDNHGQTRVTALVPPDVALSVPESATDPTAWITSVTDGSAWAEPWTLWTSPKRS